MTRDRVNVALSVAKALTRSTVHCGPPFSDVVKSIATTVSFLVVGRVTLTSPAPTTHAVGMREEAELL